MNDRPLTGGDGERGRQAAQRPLAQGAVAGERRLVHVDGVWQVYEAHEQPAFVFDATANRLIAVR